MPATWLRIPTLTALQRNIIKCSTAYFIASLFTYVPTLSHLISDVTGYGPGGEKSVPSPSAHMVATMYVGVIVCSYIPGHDSNTIPF